MFCVFKIRSKYVLELELILRVDLFCTTITYVLLLPQQKRAPPKSPEVKLLRAANSMDANLDELRRKSGRPLASSMDGGLDELRRKSGRPLAAGPPRDRRNKRDDMVLAEKLRSTVDRKSRFVEVDHEAMRRLAEERAQNAQRAAVEKSRKSGEDAARKRQEASERRASDAEAKVQRRAEIYTLNAIMSEIARRQHVASIKADMGDSGQEKKEGVRRRRMGDPPGG